MQVPYPLISLVSRMPMTLHGRCPLTMHTRTFETMFLSFASERDAIDVFESVKELTVASESSCPFHGRASPLSPGRDESCEWKWKSHGLADMHSAPLVLRLPDPAQGL